MTVETDAVLIVSQGEQRWRWGDIGR